MEAETIIEVKYPPQSIGDLKTTFENIATRIRGKYPAQIVNIEVRVKYGDSKIIENDEVTV